MARNPLYQEQLVFLAEGGRALAQAYPQVAGSLQQQGTDPDVERLLEGIAFIASKITERQAIGVDETCQLLLDILLPHYLSPVPAATIVQFSGEDPDGLYVPRGTEVVSAPVVGTSCRFRTTADVDTTSLQIAQVDWNPRGASTGLTLWLDNPAAQIRSDHLRLFLHGEQLLTRSLFEWMLTRLDRIELLDEHGLPLATLPVKPQPVGFAESEALLSYPAGSFTGFRLLQEYFALPQKFLFLDLPRVLELARDHLKGVRRFGLLFGLRVEGQTLMVTKDNFLLGCTPAINLFEHTADPIRRDHARIDYRVRPSGPHLHFDIYRVEHVTGYSRKGLIEYPLLSELDLRESGPTFAQLYRRMFEGTIHSYLFVHDERGQLPVDQTLLVDLLVSNGQLPSALAVGDIRDVPAHAGTLCRNVIPPTPYWAPQLGEELRRRLIKHLALTQQDLSSVGALKDAIELYHFPAFHEQRACRSRDLLLDAITEVETAALRTPGRSGPYLGRSTTLTINESGFESDAEIYLFGCLVDQYVARQVPINTTSRFTIRGTQTGVLFRWPTHIGTTNLQPR